MKTLLKKILITTCFTTSAFVNAAIEEQSNSFKMAVVKSFKGAKEIKTGHYDDGIAIIESNNKAIEYGEEVAQSMNLCVAYTQTKLWTQASKSCDQAIALLKTINEPSSTERTLMATAYSNRGVQRVRVEDYNGALSDFLTAVELKENKFTEQNLMSLLKKYTVEVAFHSNQDQPQIGA